MGIHKRLLLIDAVDWSAAYPPHHPLKNVGHWFCRHFQNAPGLQIIVVSSHDLLKTGIPSQTDAIIMSGSPRDAYANDPFTEQMMKEIRKIHESGIPFLGVCYGHQILARTFGGEVGVNPKGLELGTKEIRLTEHGNNSVLFRNFPPSFPVLQSHNDSVFSLPREAILLAANNHTLIQAIAMGDRMFGVQFHPETSPEILRFLWTPRIEKWQPKVTFDLEECLRKMEPAPEAVNVLHNFVGHYLN